MNIEEAKIYEIVGRLYVANTVLSSQRNDDAEELAALRNEVQELRQPLATRDGSVESRTLEHPHETRPTNSPVS